MVSLSLALTACNTTKFTQTRPDGSKVTITNARLLWQTESYTASFSSNSASLSANESTVNTQAISAVASGVAAGLAAGAK